MTEDKVAFDTLRNLFNTHAYNFASDLCSCEDQKVHTTKHERRERALAYLLEMLTGELGKFPSPEWAEGLLTVIGRIQPNVCSQEARVGLERAEKRLRWALDNPREGFTGQSPCVGRGEMIPHGAAHECSSKAAKAKDVAMARDDMVK